MRKHWQVATLTLLYVSVLLAFSRVISAEPIPVESSNLELTLTLPKTDYLLDEPLWVTLSVKNTGDSDAMIWQALLSPETSGVVFHITEPDGSEYGWDPGERADVFLTPLNALWLAPAEQFSRSIDLTQIWDRDLEKYPSMLSQPGKYAITVRGRSYKNSSTINLTVSDPKSQDKSAHDFAMQKWSALDTRAKGTAGTVWESLSREDAETLIAKYPSSAYATYARYRLAGILRNPSGQGAIDAAQKTRKAFELYSKVAKQAVNPPLGVQATMRAAEASSAIKNFGDAYLLLETAFNSPAATSEDRLDILRQMQKAQTAACDLHIIGLQATDVADAFSLRVEQDVKKRVVTLSDRNIRVELMPNTRNYKINGETHQGDYSEEPLGTYQLSVPVIADILNNKYRTKMFDNMLSIEK